MENEKIILGLPCDFYETAEQIEQINVFCEKCKQGLKSPTCIACHNHGLILWLKENISDNEIIHHIMERVGHNFQLVNMNNYSCVFCKRGMIVICRNCFILEVSRILQELNLDSLLRKFLYVFNSQPDNLNQTWG